MGLFDFVKGKEKKMVQKPVYVINGFLDSGKSSFFSYTIGQPYFQTSGTTLLIVCEEGEVVFLLPVDVPQHAPVYRLAWAIQTQRE